MTRQQLMACAGVASVLCLGGGGAVRAQAQLPEVVVTTPSPVVRARPRVEPAPAPRRRVATRTRTRTARQAAPPPAPAPAPEPVQTEDPRPIVADTFVPVTVVPSNEILRTPGATLGDTLFTQPGITGSTFAPGASRPVIRGLDNARVRVQENGVGSMDVSTVSEDHAVPIEPLAVDRLEVIRGPSTLRWGPQAIGGVVAAINNRIPDPMTPEGVNIVTKAAVSSVDAGREGGVIGEGRTEHGAVHVDYFRRKSNDYRIPGGIQANTAVDAWSASGGASYFFRDGWFGISVQHYASLYGIPGIESAENRTRIDLNQTKITGRGELRTHGTLVDTLRLWLGGSIYKHDERSLDGGVDTVKATFRNREFEGRLEAQLVPIPTPLGMMTTALGIQGGYQSLGTSGEAGSLLAPSETTRFAGYIFNEISVTETLRLQAAGRVGVVKIDGTAAMFPPDLLPDGNPVPEIQRNRQFIPASASVGLLKDLPFGLVASITGHYAERAPEALELFAKGPHEASGTFEIGNPNLSKESVAAIEVGLRKAKGDVRFDITAFHKHFNGFIFKRLTGVTCGEDFDSCGVETELKQVAYEQRNATFTGVEMMGQVDVAPLAGGTFGVDGQFDYVRARFTDGTNVPRIPPMRIGGGVFWRDGNWFTRIGVLHAFAQNAIAEEETPTAGYNLLNAEIRYTRRFAPGDIMKEITVGVLGTNLLDEDVRNHVSFKKDEVLLPGRGVRVFATVRF